MPTLYIVATPIGNLSDLSARAAAVLGQVALIAAEDTRHTRKLLSHLDIHTPLTSYHKFNEQGKSGALIEKMLDENIDVALVSDAGTPCISDPGHVLVHQAHEVGITVISVAGPSATVSALAASGFEAPAFAFYGFVPREKSEKERLFATIQADSTPVFILYESPRRIRALAKDLAAAFPGAQASFSCDLTKLHEKTRRASIQAMADTLENDEKAELGEYVVVVQKAPAAVNEETEAAPRTIESLLLDALLEGGTLKDAQAAVCAKHNLPKKAVYAAALRFKEIADTL